MKSKLSIVLFTCISLVTASHDLRRRFLPEKGRGLQEQCPSWRISGLDINGEAAGDKSGTSVSMSDNGKIVAIGALLNDGGNGVESGHVRVHKFNDELNKWEQLGSDIDGEAAYDWSGYSVSLSSNGKTVAIGARYNDAGNGRLRDSGHVRIFKYDDTVTSQWMQLGPDIDGGAGGDYFGTSVSMSSTGSVVAIGANKHDGTNGSMNSGYVQIYEWDSTVWQQRGPSIEGEEEYELSGTSVSISSDGTVVAVGAPENDTNGKKSGQVRIYKWDSLNWVKRGININGQAGNDHFGYSVDISKDGDVVAIGAKYSQNNAINGINAGYVRVYRWNTGEWQQRGNTIDGEASGDNSGISVSMASNGNVVAIGARYHSGDNGTSSGQVRVYDWSPTALWSERGLDIDGEAANDYSGGAVSMSYDGIFVAIGAIYGNGNGNEASGNVRVMEWNVCPVAATPETPKAAGKDVTSSSQPMDYQNGRKVMLAMISIMVMYML